MKNILQKKIVVDKHGNLSLISFRFHQKYSALFLAVFILFTTSIFAQTIRLKFIETSDVHGSIFPYDFINDKPINNSLAQIYSYVKEERAEKNQNVILLDDGDILQGQPVVYIIILRRPMFRTFVRRL